MSNTEQMPGAPVVHEKLTPVHEKIVPVIKLRLRQYQIGQRTVEQVLNGLYDWNETLLKAEQFHVQSNGSISQAPGSPFTRWEFNEVIYRQLGVKGPSRPLPKTKPASDAAATDEAQVSDSAGATVVRDGRVLTQAEAAG